MKMLKILITCFVLGTTALTAFSQASVGTAGSGNSSSYGLLFIPLPTSTLVGVAAAGTSTVTNFYFGYTNTIISTNINGPLYTNNLSGGTPGFYYSTNYITKNALTYPSVYIPRQSRLALSYRGVATAGANSANTTNTVFTFAQSVTGIGGQADVNHQFTWTCAVGTTNSTTVTNLTADSLSGAGYIYLIQQTWASTNGTVNIVTNLDGGIYAGIKPNAP